MWVVVLTLLAGSVALAEVELRRQGWRQDFRRLPEDWEIRHKPGVNETRFRVEESGDGDGVLVVEADDASSVFSTRLAGVDLHRTPILRWRWRVRTLPPGADGRAADRDDQAIAIYVSSGGLFRQRSIAYRWETETPVGVEGWARYAAGVVQVKWFALRNRADSAAGEWLIEERNIAHDYRRAFGFIPENPTISVTGNSQYTGTRAAAELDWIEIVAASETAAAPDTAATPAATPR